MLAWEYIQDAVAANRTSQVISACKGASEAERKACAKPAMAMLRDTFDWNGSNDALLMAGLACGSIAQLRRRCVQFGGLGTKGAYEVLIDRDPPWLDELATAILDSEHFGGWGWPLVRALVRDGRIERPDHPDYIGKMVIGIRGRIDHIDGVPEQRPIHMAPVYDRILLDPGLLEYEVQALLTSEAAARRLSGYGESGLAESGWTDAFVRLTNEGRIERLTVLEGCLNAFLSDIPASRLSWHSKFWKTMSPSLDELSQLLGRLGRVAASDASSGVGIALEALTKLQRANRLPPNELLAVLPPALQRSEKGVVNTALKLVQRAELPADEAVSLAAAALGHTHTDIQERALDLILTWAPKVSLETLRSIQPYLDSLSPSLAAKAEPLRAARTPDLAIADRTSPTAVGVPSFNDLDPAAISRLELDRAAQLISEGAIPGPLSPASTAAIGPPVGRSVDRIDDLVDLLVVLLEEADCPTQIEQALDAMVRLCDQTLPAALVERARARMKEWPGAFRGGDPRADLAAVIVAWGDRRRWKAPHPSFERPDLYEVVEPTEEFWGRLWVDGIRAVPSAFIAGRFWEAARAVSRRENTGLLATPTHELGWIEPGILFERLERQNSMSRSGYSFDFAQALLRLAPPNSQQRIDLIANAKKLRGDQASAFRAALGDSVKVPDPILRTAANWASGGGHASESSMSIVIGDPSERRYEARSKKLETVALATIADPVKQVSCADPVSLLANLSDPLGHFPHRRDIGIYSSRLTDVLRMWPAMSPGTTEIVLAGTLPICNASLAPGRTATKGVLAGIRPPEVPFGKVATLVLALGLAAADSDTRLLAIDIATEATNDGRLDGHVLGGTIGDLLRNSVIKGNRVAASLDQVARTSPLAAHRIEQTIERALPVALTTESRDLRQLLATLSDSLSLLGHAVSEPSAIASITAVAQRRGAAKLTVEARRVVSIEAAPNRPASLEAASEALHGRIRRAQDRPILHPATQTPSPSPDTGDEPASKPRRILGFRSAR